jgi:hypothetical protein
VGACCLTLLYRPTTEILHERISWKKRENFVDNLMRVETPNL